MSPVKNRQKVCKEMLMTYPVVIYTIKNFYLLESINMKLNLLNAAGLIEFWHSQVVDLRFSKVKVEKSNKKLSLKHLNAVFYIFSLGLFLALVVFTLEIVSESKTFLQMKLKLSH